MSKTVLSSFLSISSVKNLRLWCTNSGCNTHKCHPITVTADNVSDIFGRLFWNITCLDLECKQCTPELDNMYYLSCIHSKALLFVSGRVNVS